jgi:hypothetical protein
LSDFWKYNIKENSSSSPFYTNLEIRPACSCFSLWLTFFHVSIFFSAWTWLSGEAAPTVNVLPEYPTFDGVLSPTAHPGSRGYGAAWVEVDPFGHDILHFFGGWRNGTFNDWWAYDTFHGRSFL